MKSSVPHSALRLVGAGVAQSPRALPRDNTPRAASGREAGGGRVAAATYAAGPAASFAARRQAVREVESENKAASMSALDPRWALAVRTNTLLQGGRAAILPPESRRFLVSLGKDINLRPFDSNLVIAIVQDAARAGYDPLGAEARMRLKMVPEPRKEQDHPTIRWAIAALLLGIMGTWMLIRLF
jgi:hypothetical protein